MPSFSFVVIHEGYTTTQKILDSGFKYLKENYSIDYRVVEVKADTIFSIGENEIPLLVRCGSPWVANFTEKLVAAGKPFLYFIDDDFWSIDFATPLGKYYRSPSTLASLKIILSNAHTLVTTAHILGNRIKNFNQNVKVIPSFVDFSLIDKAPTAVNKASDKIRIGFASNHSRLPDFEPYEDVLISILDEYPNCEIDVIGLTPTKLGKHPKVNVFPHINSYEEYVYFQLSRAWDIGLAPLRPSRQNSAKTNNKYREYAAMSIAGIYADEVPYSEIVDGKTGLKVGANPDEWDIAIRSLIDDPNLRTTIASSGQEDVRNKYGMAKVMKEWFLILEEIAQSDEHKIVDWNRDKIVVKQSRVAGSVYLFRTQGFQKWAGYYFSKVIANIPKISSKTSGYIGTSLENIISLSTWVPPRDRFDREQPLISIIFQISDINNLGSLQKSINSVLKQKFSKFEVIIVDGSNSTEIEDLVNRLHSSHENIGIINHKSPLNSEAIANIEGYLKSRGQYVIFESSKSIFDEVALSKLAKLFPSGTEAGPISIVSGNFCGELVPTRSESEQQTINLWPISNQQLELTAIIDRRIIETIGLPDPHFEIENFSTFDFLDRISTDFNIIHYRENIASSISRENNKTSDSTSFKWQQLEHLVRNRNSVLSPNSILNYVVSENTTEPPVSSKFSVISSNKKQVLDQESRVLVISIGKAGYSKLFFQYFPEKIRWRLKRIHFPNTDLIDFSIFDQVQTLIWIGELSEIQDAIKFVARMNIEQFWLVPDDKFQALQKLELPDPVNILVSNRAGKIHPAVQEKKRKILSFPPWLSDEKIMHPLPLLARDLNTLTVAVINSQDSINFHNLVFIPELLRISELLKINVRLIQCSDFGVLQNEVNTHKYLKTYSVLKTDDAYVSLQRISNSYPDILISYSDGADSLFANAGLGSEAVAAILGCFNVSISTNQATNSLGIDAQNVNSESSLGLLSLYEVIAKLASNPELRINLAEDNRTQALKIYSGYETKNALNNL